MARDWLDSLRSLSRYLVLAAAIASLSLLLEPAWRERLANAAALLGILCLALPTVRLNEQGRKIWRVQSLLASIESQESALADNSLSGQERAKLQASLDSRRQRLREVERTLVGDRGAWTPTVHFLLYSGYALFFTSALVRLLPAP